jgi:aldehyde dehydrogenase (NAD+)
MTSTVTRAQELQIPATRDYQMFIDGAWVSAIDGALSEVTTPVLGEHVIARVPASSSVDVDRAVLAARKACPAWRSQHFTGRQRVLAKIADAIDGRSEELARVTALDTGNALRTQARPEVATLANLFRYFSGVTGEVKGTVLPAGDDQLQYTRREPATASCMGRPKPGISGVESPRRPVERF